MPVQVPVVELSVDPSSSAPEITGSAVFTGGAAAITAVCAEVAEELPAVFVPVTTTRIVEATSPATSA